MRRKLSGRPCPLADPSAGIWRWTNKRWCPISVRVVQAHFTLKLPGRVVLHPADGVEEIDVDCSEGRYYINVRAFAAAIR
jgi:hypothetical protein